MTEKLQELISMLNNLSELVSVVDLETNPQSPESQLENSGNPVDHHHLQGKKEDPVYQQTTKRMSKKLKSELFRTIRELQKLYKVIPLALKSRLTW